MLREKEGTAEDRKQKKTPAVNIAMEKKRSSVHRNDHVLLAK
jgi:hypothetical protein